MSLIVADREFDQAMEQISSSITDLSQHCQRFATLVDSQRLALDHAAACAVLDAQRERLGLLAKLYDSLAEQVKNISDSYLIDIDQADGFLY